MADSYLATGACSGCPYRSHCHTARQRAVDRSGLGRHTSCEFYQEFERRGESAEKLARSRRVGSRGWLARLLSPPFR